MGYELIKGEKCYLATASDWDIQTFLNWENDPIFARNQGRYAEIKTEEDLKQYIDEQTRNHNYIFSINTVVKRYEREELIGRIDLSVDWKNRSGQIENFYSNSKFSLNPVKCEDREVEALRLVNDFAFNGLGLHSLSSTIYKFNPYILKCAEFVGYKICGTLHDKFYYLGQYHDAVLVEMTENEYREKYKNITHLSSPEDECRLVYDGKSIAEVEAEQQA